jgi:putative nucleotidyltransferase with HDIG domain
MTYKARAGATETGKSCKSGEDLSDSIMKAEMLSLSGNLGDSIQLYRSIIRRAGKMQKLSVKAMAMRRIGNIYWRKGESKTAMNYYRRSLSISRSCGDTKGAAKAYNGIGTLYFNSGNWNKVKEYFNLAVEAASEESDLGLMANIFNNLGAMSNILGDWTMAISYYEKAQDIYKELENVKGLARIYNNLGLTYRDRGDLEKSAQYFEESIRIAGEIGDVSLKADSTLNYLQVLIRLSRLDEAREKCDEVYETLSGTEEESSMAETMLLYGMIYTRTGKWALAEKHFNESISINENHDNLLGKAECYREMALLYKEWGKNKKTLEYLGKSFNAFRALKAVRYLQEIDRKIAELEEFAFKIIRDMGAEVESKDTYTFGHSQRVAHYAVELAKKMHLETDLIKGIMVAAYLHDLGKVKVSKKILLKERKLTPEEYYIIQMHPIWGVEILEGIEFPWEVKPLIRYHQERWNGSGYPDGLSTEEIPLGARIIATADFFDALSTDRPYRSAFSVKQAIKILNKESGTSLDPLIAKKFIRIIKERLPLDYEGSLSSIPVSSFLELWKGTEAKEKKPSLLKREAMLSSIVRAG